MQYAAKICGLKKMKTYKFYHLVKYMRHTFPGDRKELRERNYSSDLPEKNIFTVITTPRTELIRAIDSAMMLMDIPAEEL